MSRECLSANTSPTNLRGYGFPWGSRTSSGAMVTVAPFTVTVLVMVLLRTYAHPAKCQWQEYQLEVRHCNSANKTLKGSQCQWQGRCTATNVQDLDSKSVGRAVCQWGGGEGVQGTHANEARVCPSGAHPRKPHGK